MIDFLRRPHGSVLAIAAIFSVQFGNAFVGAQFDRVGPTGAALLRIGFSAVILLVLTRPQVRSWTRRTWLGVVLLGAGLAGMNQFIYLAIDRIPMGIAVTIELLGPLAVAVAGVRRALDGLWVLLAGAGVVLLGLDADGSLTLAGAGFAAVAAAFWALYILASARLGTAVRGIDGLSVAMVVAAVLVAPLGTADAVGAVRSAPDLLWVFAGAAVMTSVVPYALEFVALKRLRTWVFGILSSLGPAVAALAGLLVLNQSLSALQLTAIALVVGASCGVVLTARRQDRHEAITVQDPGATSV